MPVGPSELIVLFVVGILILGPERLPRVATQIGRWVGRARRTANQLRYQLEREVTLADIEGKKKKKEEEKKKSGSNAAESESAQTGNHESDNSAEHKHVDSSDATAAESSSADGDDIESIHSADVDSDEEHNKA